MNRFPERVWESSRETWDGKRLWHSRPATREETIRRQEMLAAFEERQAQRQEQNIFLADVLEKLGLRRKG